MSRSNSVRFLVQNVPHDRTGKRLRPMQMQSSMMTAKMPKIASFSRSAVYAVVSSYRVLIDSWVRRYLVNPPNAKPTHPVLKIKIFKRLFPPIRVSSIDSTPRNEAKPIVIEDIPMIIPALIPPCKSLNLFFFAHSISCVSNPPIMPKFIQRIKM
jgi:hypothetical protein